MAGKSGIFSQSANPVLSENVLSRERAQVRGDDGVFSMQSAINKTFLLFALLILTALIGYTIASPIATIGAGIAGFVVVLIAVFNKKRSAIFAPLYAILEGIFVGGVSVMYAAQSNGLIFQAITLTMLVFFMMLMIYKTRIIPVTNKFRTGVIMATGGVMLLYVLTFVLGLFGIHVPYVHEGGTIGILISIAILGIASLNLLLDFDLFEKSEEYRVPDYMEWFAGMGLLITVVWIYVEMLRLLSKIRR